MSVNFKEYKGLNLPELAENVLHFWREESVFEQSIKRRENAPPFVFFEGPPSANGMPGIHHVMARTIKDIFCRYKTQKGFRVDRKAGWDTHGLPIELGVEKELGITKEDIGKTLSVEEYNEACRKAVMRYTDVWNQLTERAGYWVDMTQPYVTYEPKYMESVWWLLQQIYNKGLLYKGYTIQPYSPKAGTGLSSHELNQPGTYQDVTDTTVVAQFKAITQHLPESLRAFDNLYFLAWTTTPWTLPSNTALTVGPKINYVVVKTFNQYTGQPIHVVLAEALVAKVFSGKYQEADALDHEEVIDPKGKNIPYTVVHQLNGAALVGARYEQLLPYAQPFEHPENAFRVIAGDFVTTEDGTGIVHTAPTFGADDAKAAKEATPEVPPMLVKDAEGQLVPLVDLQGRFRPEVTDFAGAYVKNEYYPEGEAPEKSVDVEIAIKLKIDNKAFKVEKYVHSYPNCWRTDKPILYYPLDSWFIKVTDFRDRMHALNKEINWKPKATGEGRFGNWLASANDWNLSRSRFWGIPLPIWRTEDGRETRCIGSIRELKQAMAESVKAGHMDRDLFADFDPDDQSQENYAHVDLHKSHVDQIVLTASNGAPMYRESDLIDVWFDSGSMPYAQWHYPFENKEKVEQTWRKADFIAEGVDQTRGWFYTLHAIGTMIFDDIAYKNVVSNGLVLDKNGQKMSKRLGNAVDPFETLDTYGPDATRWYMISNANPWDNLKFDLDGIGEVRNKFFGTLYNTYGFFALYANVDGFNYSEAEVPFNERPEIDRWILSTLNSLIQTVDQAYTAYEPTKAARAISDFVQEHLSNWFVRLSRRRYWKGSYGPDKISAYQTLYQCLVTVAQLAAPIAPFFMDRLFRDLTLVVEGNGPISVHLSDFPKADLAAIDLDLERKMSKAQTVSSLVLSLRQKVKIKVRQPLQAVMIPVLSEAQKQDIEAVADLIKHEVNVKEIELISDDSGILVKQIKPDFKKLGPRFGADMKAVAAAIGQFGPDEINALEQNGSMDLEIDGKSITLDRSDVIITSQDIEGWLVASADGITVALDVTISESLKDEGICRELVNRIQNLRKDSGLEVTDRIEISILSHPLIDKALNHFGDYVAEETLADGLHIVTEMPSGQSVEFDDITTQLNIKKC
ncbi:MAG: isoleucine--tRNA ligase [Flavobacteriaceae bacterium]|nr:isoleucine--tRNA ligase [Flavobacteriaceae bacterium]